jgi:hypothetical protein
MTQIFMLNMTYDVPVKLLSFHLILLSLLILAPDRRRLANFFFLDRPAEPVQRGPQFATRRGRRIAGGCMAFLWVWMIGNNIYGAMKDWRQFGPGAPRASLYGIWSIEDFALDDKPHPLLVTEAQQWRRVVFDFPDLVQVQRMDESGVGYDAKVDPHASTIALTDQKDKNWKASFTFTRPGADRLTLEGTINGQKAALHLRLLDHTKFRLATSGFHWIQDYPFNR